jgi:predicted phosphodiesterase
MMSKTARRLTEVFEAARVSPEPFDDTSRIVVFSDCHRGDNGWADDFAHNQIVLWHALKFYLREGFTYVEAGDGDELWENAEFEDIRLAHSHIFDTMREFHEVHRLRLLWGNHDIERRDPGVVRQQLHRARDPRTQIEEPLLEGIEVKEGLVLRHETTGREVFIVHGHQGDGLNDDYVWLSRALVRHLWKPAQVWGANDPTLPSQNVELRLSVEWELAAWAEANRQVTICGHTHQSYFPQTGKRPYFNAGSCVHPRCNTGIEIDRGQIRLIKWSTKPDDDGVMKITKELVRPETERPLHEFFG